MSRTRNYKILAERLLLEKFPDAACAFVTGSIITGDDTPSSDIDFVVLFNDQIHETYRDSTKREGWPIEIFVHNLKSQDYFFEQDRKRGFCVMMNMISKSVIIGKDAALGQSRKILADKIIAAGPEPLTQAQLDWSRYAITDLVDDLRHPKDPDYIPAILAKLFNIIGDFYLRAQSKWSGDGKQLIRILKQDNPDFSQKFLHAFRTAHQHDLIELENLVAQILAPYGGPLSENYKSVTCAWENFQP